MTLLAARQWVLLTVGTAVVEDKVTLELLEHLGGNLRILVFAPRKPSQKFKHLPRDLLPLDLETDDAKIGNLSNSIRDASPLLGVLCETTHHPSQT